MTGSGNVNKCTSRGFDGLAFMGVRGDVQDAGRCNSPVEPGTNNNNSEIVVMGVMLHGAGENPGRRTRQKNCQ